LENWLIDSRFPVPNKYTTNFRDYLSEVTSNEELEAVTRIKAARELGVLEGLRVAQRFSTIFQLNYTGVLALKRYARLANRFAQT
jgi:hypothetical protein